MRISDWSSDVCSSDLLIAVVTDRQTRFVQLRRPAQERQSGRTIKSPHGRELFVDAQRGTFDGPRVFGIDAVALRHCLHRVIADIAVAQSADRKSTRLNSSH